MNHLCIAFRGGANKFQPAIVSSLSFKNILFYHFHKMLHVYLYTQPIITKNGKLTLHAKCAYCLYLRHCRKGTLNFYIIMKTKTSWKNFFVNGRNIGQFAIQSQIILCTNKAALWSVNNIIYHNVSCSCGWCCCPWPWLLISEKFGFVKSVLVVVNFLVWQG